MNSIAMHWIQTAEYIMKLRVHQRNCKLVPEVLSHLVEKWRRIPNTAHATFFLLFLPLHMGNESFVVSSINKLTITSNIFLNNRINLKNIVSPVIFWQNAHNQSNRTKITREQWIMFLQRCDKYCGWIPFQVLQCLESDKSMVVILVYPTSLLLLSVKISQSSKRQS